MHDRFNEAIKYTLQGDRASNNASNEKQHHEAIQYYSLALNLKNKNDSYKKLLSLLKWAHIRRGNSYTQLKQYQQALHDYQQFLGINNYLQQKHAWFCHIQLARTYLQLNKHDLTIKHFTKSLTYHPNTFILEELKQLLMTAEQDNTILSKINKETLLDAFSVFPASLQKAFLEKCLDPETTLGKRFRKQRGFTKCSLQKGALKKASDALSVLRNSNMTLFKLTHPFASGNQEPGPPDSQAIELVEIKPPQSLYTTKI